MSSETRTCQNCKNQFTIEPEDFDFYKKIDVPPPTWCPLCRMQRRMAFRNDRYVYKRKSDSSGNEIFSMFPPESFQKIYENAIWFSDQWDPLHYGRDIDFSRPFLEQVRELWHEVPIFSLSAIRGENSDYSNNYTGFKNCYLVFNGNYAEDCMYGNGTNNTKNCVDFSYVDKSEFCYELGFSLDCSRCFFSTTLRDCYNMWFSKNCSGCHDCLGCVNLRNKSYCIWNKQYTKEEYERTLAELQLSSREYLGQLRKEAHAFWSKFPNKYAENNKTVNSSGSYIYNSKNVRDSWFVMGSEDCRYCQGLLGPSANKDCYDYTIWGNGAELIYETAASGLGIQNSRFCWECFPENKNLEYCVTCGNSSDLFGCVGLKKKQYCILNKQYSREEYFKLREKIINNMNEMPYVDKQGQIYKYGEFFPAEFSPYPYNHTLAQEQFPLGVAEAAHMGLYWKESEVRRHKPTMRWSELPDSIDEVGDEITKEIIVCRSWEEDRLSATNHNCTGAFRIVPQELQFYRQFKFPVPQQCFNTRHYERIQERSKVLLYHQRCQCAGSSSENGIYRNLADHPHHGQEACTNQFESPHSPEDQRIVYCEPCYNAEVA